jgi:hypothetical protein
MTQMGLTPRNQVTTSFYPMVAALAYLPFRVVCAPTAWVGRVAAWLADGYRTASPLERLLIFPSWAIFRGLFFVGWALARQLHTAARRAVEG